MSDVILTQESLNSQAPLIYADLSSMSDADLFAGIRALLAEIAVNSFTAVTDALDTLASERRLS